MSLARQTSRLPAWWTQVLGVLLVLATGRILWAGSRSRHVLGYLRQWPTVLGVLAGLVWWLSARPSWLGWILVALSVWGALRMPIPHQRLRYRGEMTGGDGHP
jgi:hypothetical protein